MGCVTANWAPTLFHTFNAISREGCCADEAAQAIAKLGNSHDICVVRGGFKAWRDEGLPTGRLRSNREQAYLSVDDLDAPTFVPEILLGSSSHRKPIFLPKLFETLTSGKTVHEEGGSQWQPIH